VPGSAFITAAGTAGYGITESQAGEGAHHRGEASVAVALRPVPALAVSLSFDGRYDAHPGGDDGAVGLPSLSLVYARALTQSIFAGGALSLSLPGQTAPSLDFAAAVLTASALGAFTLAPNWLLLAQLGVRLDNSAHAAPDVERLSLADRLALGLSDFHAVPLGAAITTGLGPAQVSGELSCDLLVGKGAPSLRYSPLRAAVVTRLPVARSLSLELLARLSLSARPDYERVYPLLPVEPRFSLGLGLRYAAEDPPQVTVHQPEHTEVYATVTDTEGAVFRDALVVLRVGSHVDSARSGEDGSIHFHAVPRGEAQLQVTAEEIEPLERRVLLDRSELAISLQVTRHSHGSQLRGLVRSFEGLPLQAAIRVLPEGRSVSADKDGRFMLELAPGSYQVEIECSGYRTQRRKVTVQQNGVTLLNVELRTGRP
jgi:hypothetical protein